MYELDEVDVELMQATEEGRKYLEYHKVFNSKPFAYGVGMPDIDELFGGIIGLYDECIKQGETWEELIGSGWDELKD